MTLLVLLGLPAGAAAIIHPASPLDGPANDILDVDGAAMAADSSGGVVYRKQVEGVTHVFAVPFHNGAWGQPVEVDTEDAYGASQPAIAAGEGGRLLVVWVQPRNVSSKDVVEYALMSASLQPGASAFGQAIMVDPNVGEPDTGDISGVQPKLAMAPDGTAYVVYRVTADDCGIDDQGNSEEAKCRPGSTDKIVYVRAARFNYLTWSSLGTINRSTQLPMRDPSSSNAPAIGIDVNGNGVVAWQEPDVSGVARIWVRRLFGTVKGNVLEASPETVGVQPVTSDAEIEPLRSVASAKRGLRSSSKALPARPSPRLSSMTTRCSANSILTAPPCAARRSLPERLPQASARPAQLWTPLGVSAWPGVRTAPCVNWPAAIRQSARPSK